MHTLTVIGELHSKGKDYVLYGDGLKAECCPIDLRSPALAKLQPLLKLALGRLSKKQLGQLLDLPLWAIKALLRDGGSVPTLTILECIQQLENYHE